LKGKWRHHRRKNAELWPDDIEAQSSVQKANYKL
jgi:hypothetical protein